MKIIFFGTPDFAVSSLRKLFSGNHKVEAVVTAPDKERGRGRKISYTPVKEFAVENGLGILQPNNLKDPEFVEQLKSYSADLFVIVAFKILSPEVFTIPPKGSFNLHASLLPKYRGAAPIQWSLINGEKETGVTTFFLKEKVDTGNILSRKKVKIDEEDNFETLHNKLMELGAELVLETVKQIENGEIKELPQDDSLATPAPKITKETCEINWDKPAESIHNLIRGLSPIPGAFFIKNSKLYKIYESKVVLKNLKPGEVEQTKNNLIIGCGENALQILELQPEGRNRMSAEEFLRGYSLT
jgi:methionyl-tRNA formyltransferase